MEVALSWLAQASGYGTKEVQAVVEGMCESGSAKEVYVQDRESVERMGRIQHVS